MPDDTRKENEKMKTFIQPEGRYTFSSERASPRSELCREQGDNRRECIMLQLYSTQLFEAMQANGFYCALPSDPAQTHMECNRIPKS